MDVFHIKSGVPCFSFIFAVLKQIKMATFFILFPFDFVSFQTDYPPDLTDNDLVTPLYDFDDPSYHAEEEGAEDCDQLELARSLK